MIHISFGVYSDIFVKGGQAVGATEVRVTSFIVKPNPTICISCVWTFVYVLYDNLYTLCMTTWKFLYYYFYMLCMKICLCCVWQFLYVVYDIFWLLFFLSILCITFSMTPKNIICYISYSSVLKKVSPNCCLWSCWFSHTSWRRKN